MSIQKSSVIKWTWFVQEDTTRAVLEGTLHNHKQRDVPPLTESGIT